MFQDHCGGLTFGGDGKLYYVASRWRDAVYNPMPPPHKEMQGVVWRLDPVTLQREEVTRLVHPTGPAQYVSRGAVDHNGDLFFGHVGSRPCGHLQGGDAGQPQAAQRAPAHSDVGIGKE